MSLLGAVLAGGHSRRMGRDKALLLLRGQPLWQRQLQVLAAAGASPVLLVRRPDQAPLAPAPLLDLRRDAGPMAGLEAALLAAPKGGRVAVLAVDMPFLDAGWHRWLLEQAAAAGCGGAVAQSQGRFEPLAALYPASALAAVQRHLDAGRFALQPLVRELAAAGLIAAPEAPSAFLPAIRSVNTVAACPSTIATSL